MSEAPLDASAVLERAWHEGQAWVDDDVAARIAAGAAPATRAVAMARRSIGDTEVASPESSAFVPADAVRAGEALLGALESLAADDA